MRIEDPTDLLAAYSADLEYAQHLSVQEQQALIATAVEQGSHLDREARNRLLEEYLALAKNMALKLCPFAYRHLLPDILGDLNLTLLRALERFNPSQTRAALSTYLYSYIEGSIRTSIHRRRLIHIPHHTLHKMLQQENRQPLNQLEPLSVQACMQRWQREEEPSMQPIHSSQAASESDSQRQAQIEEWLSHLPTRDEQMVRLHYGLTEGDEHCYSIPELCTLLGLTSTAVTTVLRRSRLRLSKLAQGTASFYEQEGRTVVKNLEGGHPFPVLTEEQEQRLRQAMVTLCEQASTVSTRTLSQATGLSALHTRAFLNAHRQEIAPQYVRGTPERRTFLQQERMQRLKQVSARLLAEGQSLSEQRLVEEARVPVLLARSFLSDHRHTS